MTRAHITALALILAVGTWNPPTLVRADRAAVDGPPPRRPPTRQELAEIVPVETSRARSVATPEIGPASLKTITRLAFQSFRDNNYEIYIADGDASNETRITNNSAADISPRLNHGADRIAFASKRDGNYEIYTVSVTGSELKRLTNSAAEDSDPFWSPDGTRILFTSNRDSNYEIYVMNADGTKEGYDVELTRAISDAVTIPVIASGGAGRPEHFQAALTDGGAAAALAASLFHFRELSIMEIKQGLRAAGVEVRFPLEEEKEEEE